MDEILGPKLLDKELQKLKKSKNEELKKAVLLEDQDEPLESLSYMRHDLFKRNDLALSLYLHQFSAEKLMNGIKESGIFKAIHP